MTPRSFPEDDEGAQASNEEDKNTKDDDNSSKIPARYTSVLHADWEELKTIHGISYYRHKETKTISYFHPEDKLAGFFTENKAQRDGSSSAHLKLTSLANAPAIPSTSKSDTPIPEFSQVGSSSLTKRKVKTIQLDNVPDSKFPAALSQPTSSTIKMPSVTSMSSLDEQKPFESTSPSSRFSTAFPVGKKMTSSTDESQTDLYWPSESTSTSSCFPATFPIGKKTPSSSTDGSQTNLYWSSESTSASSTIGLSSGSREKCQTKPVKPLLTKKLNSREILKPLQTSSKKSLKDLPSVQSKDQHHIPLGQREKSLKDVLPAEPIKHAPLITVFEDTESSDNEKISNEYLLKEISSSESNVSGKTEDIMKGSECAELVLEAIKGTLNMYTSNSEKMENLEKTVTQVLDCVKRIESSQLEISDKVQTSTDEEYINNEFEKNNESDEIDVQIWETGKNKQTPSDSMLENIISRLRKLENKVENISDHLQHIEVSRSFATDSFKGKKSTIEETSASGETQISQFVYPLRCTNSFGDQKIQENILLKEDLSAVRTLKQLCSIIDLLQSKMTLFEDSHKKHQIEKNFAENYVEYNVVTSDTKAASSSEENASPIRAFLDEIINIPPLQRNQSMQTCNVENIFKPSDVKTFQPNTHDKAVQVQLDSFITKSDKMIQAEMIQPTCSMATEIEVGNYQSSEDSKLAVCDASTFTAIGNNTQPLIEPIANESNDFQRRKNYSNDFMSSVDKKFALLNTTLMELHEDFKDNLKVNQKHSVHSQSAAIDRNAMENRNIYSTAATAVEEQAVASPNLSFSVWTETSNLFKDIKTTISQLHELTKDKLSNAQSESSIPCYSGASEPQRISRSEGIERRYSTFDFARSPELQREFDRVKSQETYTERVHGIQEFEYVSPNYALQKCYQTTIGGSLTPCFKCNDVTKGLDSFSDKVRAIKAEFDLI